MKEVAAACALITLRKKDCQCPPNYDIARHFQLPRVVALTALVRRVEGAEDGIELSVESIMMTPTVLTYIGQILMHCEQVALSAHNAAVRLKSLRRLKQMTQYIAELSLLSASLTKANSRLLACVCHFLARKTCLGESEEGWPPDLARCMDYDRRDIILFIKEYADDISQLFMYNYMSSRFTRPMYDHVAAVGIVVH